MASPIKNNPFTAEQHLKYFAEFVQAVQEAGGTTPHMLMTVEAASRQKSLEEKLWWAGCYLFVYNFATAELINMTWRPGSWSDPKEISEWARENWKGIKFRKERKAARSPEKLAECMSTYYEFQKAVPHLSWFKDPMISAKDRYNLAFEEVCEHVKYAGRYIGIRWVEVMRRLFDLDMQMPDLRPEDGDHPRKALALMFPEHEIALMGGNSDAEIAETNSVVEKLLSVLENKFKVKTDYYTIQSLLCEYKQSVLSKKQFPGKSIDSEISYWNKVVEYWGEEYSKKSIIWDVREKIFPSWVLGEKNGWNGVREELGEILVKHEYTWSDKIYDYRKTTLTFGGFGNPVLRDPNRKTILEEN